jgi:hypothetical protein
MIGRRNSGSGLLISCDSIKCQGERLTEDTVVAFRHVLSNAINDCASDKSC